MCPELATCANCTLNPECIWCTTKSACILRSAVQAYFPFGDCIDYVSVHDKCPRTPPKSAGPSLLLQSSSLSRQFDMLAPPIYSSCQIHYSNCSACIMDERCGWCSSDIFNKSIALIGENNSGAGQCMEGAYSRSKDDMCRLNWYFTECPMCECNGHATCERNRRNVTNYTQVAQTCGECANNTEGEGCGECSKGFYGFPENNGKLNLFVCP